MKARHYGEIFLLLMIVETWICYNVAVMKASIELSTAIITTSILLIVLYCCEAARFMGSWDRSLEVVERHENELIEETVMLKDAIVDQKLNIDLVKMKNDLRKECDRNCFHDRDW